MLLLVPKGVAWLLLLVPKVVLPKAEALPNPGFAGAARDVLAPKVIFVVVGALEEGPKGVGTDDDGLVEVFPKGCNDGAKLKEGAAGVVVVVEFAPKGAAAVVVDPPPKGVVVACGV